MLHEEVVDMLVVRKEAQVDGAHVEAGVDAHPGVVTYLGVLLGAEHAGRGAEDGCVITREIAQVDAYLCVECLEPSAVVVEAVLEDGERHGHDRVVGAVLDDDAVLEVDPRGGEVEADVAGDDLYVTVELTGFPVGGGDVDRVGLVLKTEVDTGLEPFVEVRDRRTAHEAVCEAEVIVPPKVVGAEVLVVPAGFLALGVRACGYLKRILTRHELRLEGTVYVKLADLITEQADLSLDVVVDV